MQGHGPIIAEPCLPYFWGGGGGPLPIKQVLGLDLEAFDNPGGIKLKASFSLGSDRLASYSFRFTHSLNSSV